MQKNTPFSLKSLALLAIFLGLTSSLISTIIPVMYFPSRRADESFVALSFTWISVIVSVVARGFADLEARVAKIEDKSHDSNPGGYPDVHRRQ